MYAFYKHVSELYMSIKSFIFNCTLKEHTLLVLYLFTSMKSLKLKKMSTQCYSGKKCIRDHDSHIQLWL